MKSLLRLGALLLMSFLLAGLPACDSSSSGGGTTTGYTVADLAGVWELRFAGSGDRTMIIDDQGRIRSYSRPGCGYANTGWVFQVFSDGRVWAKGRFNCSLAGHGSNWRSRWNGKFNNSSYISGTVTFQGYNGQILVTPTAKVDFSMHKQ